MQKNKKAVFELTDVPHKNQQLILDGRKRFTVVEAGRRFGKSVCAKILSIELAANNPNVLVWYIGPYLNQVKEIIWEAFVSSIPPQFIARKREDELKIWLVNGSIIELKGADNEDSLRGVGAHKKLRFVVFEEAGFMRKNVWETIVRPPLMDMKGEAFFISSPGKGWFTKLCRKAEMKAKTGDPDWAYFHFSCYDNPCLPDGEIEKAREDTSDHIFRVEYLAETPEAGGLVYPEFSEPLHVIDPIELQPAWWQARACDWGINAPTVVLWGAVDPKTKILYVNQEFYQRGWLIRRVAESVRAMSQGPRAQIRRSVIDRSAIRRESGEDEMQKGRFSSVLQGFANNGIYWQLASNRKQHDIELVRRFLEPKKDGLPSLRFFRTCRNTLREIVSYEYDDEGVDIVDPREVPKESHHDAMDALRYLVSEVYRAGVARINPLQDGIILPSGVNDGASTPDADPRRLRQSDVDDGGDGGLSEDQVSLYI